ncbi:MAG TPA: metalloregulator ArsR/SmtB family transcription factor [Natrialbaceae archaeon]|nr:metalloregulator ArsR/SmtB family transcription factor [Natrialbaceae archaeon]
MSDPRNPDPGRKGADTAEPCCAEAVHDLSADDLTADVERLAAAGNDTRYEALRYVAAAEDGLCVCDLEPALGVSQGAVSQALSRLFTAGLVTRRKEGKWRYYEATPATRRLLDTMDAIREASDD